MAEAVKFPYSITGGELGAERTLLMVPGCRLEVIGKKTRRVFSKGFAGTCSVTAFYIRYEGVEYGSCKINRTKFIDLVQGEDEDGLFDIEFEDIFE